MRKYTIALIFLAGAACAAAFDPGVIAWDVKPGKIVADQSNSLKDGWVVETGFGLQYYGNWITHTINVKKDDPEKWYIYYKGLEDKKAFYEFFSDMIRYYSEEAVLIIPDASIDDSEVQVSLKIVKKDGRSLVIYSKEPSTSGIRGFGITNVVQEPGEVTIDRIINEASGRVILPLDKFDAKDYESGVAYASGEFLDAAFSLEVEFGDPTKTGDRYYVFRGILESEDLMVPIRFEWNSGMELFKTKILGLLVYDGMGVFLDLLEREGNNPNVIVNLCANKAFTLYLRTSDPAVPSGKLVLTVNIGNP